MSQERQYRDILDSLLKSPNPIVRYKSHVNILGADASAQNIRTMRDEIKTSAIAQSLLTDLADANPSQRDGLNTLYGRLKYLADIDYPPGDETLLSYRDRVHGWIRRLEKEYDEKLFIKDKYRVHGSFHGNALYASIVLGMVNQETDELCDNLIGYQWPGGGWNCSKVPKAIGPTIVHTAYGMRGLVAYQAQRDTPALRTAIELCAEILLDRHVYLKRTDSRPLRPVYTKMAYPYPRLYNFMVGLHILTRAGYVTDVRCTEALDLLESKFIEGQGWPMERKLFHHNPKKEGHTDANWELEKLGKASLFLTVDALEILQKANRFSPPI
jgi:hypothetical protein|tara:strand:+ start:66 stop:1046 length:981 start_codon:yes stop_codon:yes gene_type:complete